MRVRVGLHTGAPSLTDEGYTGIDVVRASRIANAGHGGQILVSADTLALLDGIASRDLGEFRLEGLAMPGAHPPAPRRRPPARLPPASEHGLARSEPGCTVVLADDTVLLREGVARLLADAGFEVVAQSGNPDDLLRHVAMHKPDVAIVDIRMPPTHTDEGLRAAREIRRALPGDERPRALAVRRGRRTRWTSSRRATEGLGYLLKDRVADVEEFATAVRRVAEGGSALDPEVVAELARPKPRARPARRS